MAFDRRQSHICHQDEWVSGWVSEWVSVTIESWSWPNFKPMFPGPTSCCFWSILVPYFLGYKAYSVIRRTLNFWTCFFLVDKLKILPKYPVLRCNLNFFTIFIFKAIAFSKFLITVMSPFFNKRRKSHTFVQTRQKKLVPLNCYHIAIVIIIIIVDILFVTI